MEGAVRVATVMLHIPLMEEQAVAEVGQTTLPQASLLPLGLPSM